MKTQRELLAAVLADLADVKKMLARVDSYVTELRNSEQHRRQEDLDQLSSPGTLTVNEDQDCMEFDAASLHLDREERVLINAGVHFSIRGTDVLMDDNDPESEVFYWIIWEFNRSRSERLCVYAVHSGDKEGYEDDLNRSYIYEGPIQSDLFRED